MPRRSSRFVEFVYVLASARHIKIGCSVDVASRVREMRKFDGALQFVACRPHADESIERQFLAIARGVSDPVHGREVFPFSRKLLDALDSLLPQKAISDISFKEVEDAA